MISLWPLALITFKEGIRNRVFYSISLLSLLLVGANFIITGMIPQEAGKVAVDVALSALSFTGLLLVVFIGINLIAKDLDKRTIYLILARPVSRTQYVLGKFFGLAMILLITLIIVFLFALLSLVALKSAYPNYFLRFSWAMVLLAAAFIFLMLLMLSALSVLFSSLTSSSFTTLILTMVTYVIGQSLGDIKAIVETQESIGIQVSSATVALIKAAYFIFPNLSLFDIKSLAAHGIPVSAAYVFWSVLYGLVYSILALGLAAVLFRRKEFP